MALITLEVSDKIYKNIPNKNLLKYEDLIEFYEESSFSYEKIQMKAKDFKSYLIKELSNG